MSTSSDFPLGVHLADGAMSPLTVTVATARKISGLGNTKLWELIRDRKLETVHVGRRTLITFQSLKTLLTPSSWSEPQPPRRGRPRKAPTPDGGNP
jgi:hypothetical protein